MDKLADQIPFTEEAHGWDNMVAFVKKVVNHSLKNLNDIDHQELITMGNVILGNITEGDIKGWTTDQLMIMNHWWAEALAYRLEKTLLKEDGSLYNELAFTLVNNSNHYEVTVRRKDASAQSYVSKLTKALAEIDELKAKLATKE